MSPVIYLINISVMAVSCVMVGFNVKRGGYILAGIWVSVTIVNVLSAIAVIAAAPR